MISKKGLSEVVAAVFLVLLTIISAVLIVSFVYPFVKNMLSKGTECQDYLDYFSFNDEFEFNCYTLDSGTYSYVLSVAAESSDKTLDDKIKGLELVFIKEGGVIPIGIDNGAPEKSNLRMIDPSETLLKVPASGETFTYIYTSSIDFDNVNVHPVLKSKRKCQETDTISIKNRVCQNALP